MTESTYAALITISLPGVGESVTMTVTLMPQDNVQLHDGQTRLLRDCTLRDLQSYAAELEADVWDTYEEITLLNLDEDEQIEITVGRHEGEIVADWSSHAILLPHLLDHAETPSSIPAKPDQVKEGERPFLADEMTALEPEVDSPDEPAEQVSEPAVQAVNEDPPDLTVDEAQLVFPEIEEDQTGQGVTFPAIIPSKARVRVAGERLPSGHPTQAAVDILLDEPALRAAQAHALSSLNREVAGILVGPRPEKQPDGRYLVHVIDTIVAKYTVMQGASVTYTPESWRYLNDTLAERYPDETAVMAGWYHTHPGFGIFLSGMDLFIHQNFFTQIWHVAMVLDPRARTSGFFCWDRAKSRVSRHDFAWPKWAMGSW